MNIQKLLDDDFEKAIVDVKVLTNINNKNLLDLYSYYKQATVGNSSNIEPSLLDFKGHTKWKTWSKLRNMSRQTAQVKYIKLVAKLLDGHTI